MQLAFKENSKMRQNMTKFERISDCIIIVEYRLALNVAI